MIALRRFAPVLALLALLAVPAGAAAPTRLRLDGVGPLKLGMTRAAAVATGWLAQRSLGCELASPRPVSYRISGQKAPARIRGYVDFVRGKLVDVSLTRGVRTRVGVVPGQTSTSDMVRRYRQAGFRASARFVSTFGGTFITVKRGNRQVLGGFATRHVVRTLGIPAVPVCE